MHATAIRVINFPSQPPPYNPHILLKLYFLMYGLLPFTHMMDSNITSFLSIILQNISGSIHYKRNMMLRMFLYVLKPLWKIISK